MNNLEMTNDERIIRAKVLFLGKVYFHIYGGFSLKEFEEKMEHEFQVLNVYPYSSDVLGLAHLDNETIDLFSMKEEYLDTFSFSSNIHYYRSTILHEMLHKFFIKRDLHGVLLSTGLSKYLLHDALFQEEIMNSKIEKKFKNKIKSLSWFENNIDENFYGIGADEEYVEWFRINVLKNDENVQIEVSNVFSFIQKIMEQNGEDAVSILKKFRNGDYDFLFKSLHLSKEVGFFFLRLMDIRYIKLLDNYMIATYLNYKEEKTQLLKSNLDGKLDRIREIEEYCVDVENKFIKIFQEKFHMSLKKTDFTCLFQEIYEDNLKFENKFIEHLLLCSLKKKYTQEAVLELSQVSILLTQCYQQLNDKRYFYSMLFDSILNVFIRGVAIANISLFLMLMHMKNEDSYRELENTFYGLEENYIEEDYIPTLKR